MILGVIFLIYLIVPFIWSVITTGVKETAFRFMVDYGIYILIFVGGGGYLWWKWRAGQRQQP
jgi:hypothetical protein